MPDLQLTKIPGIGPTTARILTENGYSTVGSIAQAAQADLAKVQGFGKVRAAVAINAAQALLSVDVTPNVGAAPKKDKKDKKGKAKKRKKKQKKDKRRKKKDKKRKKKRKK